MLFSLWAGMAANIAIAGRAAKNCADACRGHCADPIGDWPLQGLPHRLFAEGRQVHVAAAVGLDGGFRYFEEQALGWVLEERDATGAKFDDSAWGPLAMRLTITRTSSLAGFAPHVADEGVDLGVDIGCGELFVDYGVDAGGNADAQPSGLERAGYHLDVVHAV